MDPPEITPALSAGRLKLAVSFTKKFSRIVLDVADAAGVEPCGQFISLFPGKKRLCVFVFPDEAFPYTVKALISGPLLSGHLY